MPIRQHGSQRAMHHASRALQSLRQMKHLSLTYYLSAGLYIQHSIYHAHKLFLLFLKLHFDNNLLRNYQSLLEVIDGLLLTKETHIN
jgi:hypothetical protein